MILVDTSVWIDFLRGKPAALELRRPLEQGEVLSHAFVIGELALGNLGARRSDVLSDLRLLPAAPLLENAEVHEMVDAHRLAGRGIGWVDAHLLASARVAGAALWTLDRGLEAAATRLGVSHR